MSVAVSSLFAFDNTFVRDLEGLYQPWQAATVPAPELLLLNDDLATELGLDAAALSSPAGVAALVGNAVPEGASPVAQAYSGHQFGGFSPVLGDGRALLLGEILDAGGGRRDLHLKGSGRTPFARGGDGKAAVGPMLREYLIGEAMHALGIPTTRALAVVGTGERIRRETPLPGAVLARVAASHLRVGTFQYAATRGDGDLVARLADYAIARHHRAAAAAANPYLGLLDAVAGAQASLIARWMLVGFVHGVMNTDNMTISGETIDYGPCAFMEAYDPATVFSSIDHGGRYAYGNQPGIAQWNLARLAETLLPLINSDTDAAIASATEIVHAFDARFRNHLLAGMRAKLGLQADDPDAGGDPGLIEDLFDLLRRQKVDFTVAFRALADHVRGEGTPARSLFIDPPAFDAWAQRWSARLASQDAPAVAEAMDRVNPVYIPRNHRVEEALDAATSGDLDPARALLDAITRPFTARPGLESYAGPAPEDFTGYRTFCGT